MKKCTSDISIIKHKVLIEVIKSATYGNVFMDSFNIAKKIIPGPKPTTRCCIYKEREIILERIGITCGGDENNKNIIEVLPTACDECPVGGYTVTDRCRGCLARNCQQACMREAVIIKENRLATIDNTKCVNCGMCAQACLYGAIVNIERPCEKNCPVKAIKPGDNFAASIDDEKCIQCGKCVVSCPFGAIMEKSELLSFISLRKKKNTLSDFKLFAIVAPSIGIQFKEIPFGKVISGLKKLGFDDIYEAALGADYVAIKEAKELVEKGTLTTSCCPAFVNYIEKEFPTLKGMISSNLSPMLEMAKRIKEKEPNCKIVFFGPCVAKKGEARKIENKNLVDVVLSFEELIALFEAYDISINVFPEDTSAHEGSKVGRNFAVVGGVANAIQASLKEQNINFEVKAKQADGIINIKNELTKLKNKQNDFNLLEGMACQNGCINGPLSSSHDLRDKIFAKQYADSNKIENITDAIKKEEDKQ